MKNKQLLLILLSVLKVKQDLKLESFQLPTRKCLQLIACGKIVVGWTVSFPLAKYKILKTFNNL